MENDKLIYIEFLVNDKPIGKRYTKKIYSIMETFRSNKILYTKLLKLMAQYCVEVEERKLMFQSKRDIKEFVKKSKELKKCL